MRYGRLTYHVSLCRIDVKFALVGATEPVYPAVLKESGNYPDLGTQSDLSIIGNRCLSLEGAPGAFQNELKSIIRHLSDITRYIESHRLGLIEDNNKYEFEAEQRTHIEHRLLSIHVGKNSIEGCCRLAMLLFVNTVLWDGK